MNRLKRYLENHKDATIEDYNNQRHSMIIMQAIRNSSTKHVGSKNLKQFLALQH